MPNVLPKFRRRVLRHAVVILQRILWVTRGRVGPRDERMQVGAGEWILRRIHKNHFKPSKPTPVERVAFQPSDEDVDGLSVFRAAFVSPGQIVADSRGGNSYYVARLAVRELGRFTPPLTVAPDPDPDQPPGHAVIPELNAIRLKTEKYPSKELQRDLAKLAAKNIVFRPGDPLPMPLSRRAVRVALAWLRQNL